MADTSGEEWLSGPQAARLLGLQLHTLHALIDRGELVADVVPAERRPKGRRSIRIRRQDIDDYIERARVKPGPAAPSPRVDLGTVRLGTVCTPSPAPSAT